MLKTAIVMLLVIVTGTFGNIFISKGMKSVGEIQSLHFLLPFFGRAFSNLWVVSGVILLTAYFLLWVSLLSWTDLSLALPLTAVSYITTAVFAGLLLGEEVDSLRWGGTLLISLGVVLVALSARFVRGSAPSH